MPDDSNRGHDAHGLLSDGPLLDTNAVAARYKRSPRTIRGWIMHGCPTPNGRVHLPAMRMGRTWMVREEDCLLFEHRTRPWK